MTKSRDRRPKPEPVSSEEEAEIEAKYRLLHRQLKRYAARMTAHDPDYFTRVQAEAEARADRPPPTAPSS
ncbi:MAG: hypothetical protein Q7T19_15500 [Caulobacter sp.]|nr:hypothetical protein [Caulobacter sp.]